MEAPSEPAETDCSTSRASQPAIEFFDLDDEDVFNGIKGGVATNATCRNFVVEFSHAHARIAYNLDKQALQTLPERTRPKDFPVRWINIWDPSHPSQIDGVSALSEQYGLSTRMRSIMRIDKDRRAKLRTRAKRPAVPLNRQHRNDLEQGPTNDGLPLDDLGGSASDDTLKLYYSIKDRVNYADIDLTSRALCTGAHWLHQEGRPGNKQDRQKSILPPRHWRWLVLCNDHTVMSIHEPSADEEIPQEEDEKAWTMWKNNELQNIRSNTLTVLKQLSIHGSKSFTENILYQAPIREPVSCPEDKRRGSDVSSQSMRASKSPPDEWTSNLFYYLFEDYAVAGPLKRAGLILEYTTKQVLKKRKRNVKEKAMNIIPTLHHLSKDLRELRHLCKTYKNLISKIMSNCKENGSPSSMLRGTINSIGTALQEENDQPSSEGRRLFLSDSALNRFDRLTDRIDIFTLSTIEGYLEEIQALSSTYFNLTQQKDSEATARLNRSATLLAKLSVFFLPISFMTSYFSVQIEPLYQYWTAKTYWYSFAVIATVSFTALFFFSRILMFFSDILDGWSEQIAEWLKPVGRALGYGRHDEDDE